MTGKRTTTLAYRKTGEPARRGGEAEGYGLFSGDVGRIAEIAGPEAALRIAKALKGSMIYINSLEGLFREARNAGIRKDHRGGMCPRRLAAKYGLSNRAVRKILGSPGERLDRRLAALVARVSKPSSKAPDGE